MNVIVIDDEPAPLLTFASHILDNAAVTANMFSLKVDEALEFARTHEWAIKTESFFSANSETD